MKQIQRTIRDVVRHVIATPFPRLALLRRCTEYAPLQCTKPCLQVERSSFNTDITLRTAYICSGHCPLRDLRLLRANVFLLTSTI